MSENSKTIKIQYETKEYIVSSFFRKKNLNHKQICFVERQISLKALYTYYSIHLNTATAYS